MNAIYEADNQALRAALKDTRDKLEVATQAFDEAAERALSDAERMASLYEQVRKAQEVAAGKDALLAAYRAQVRRDKPELDLDDGGLDGWVLRIASLYGRAA